MKNTLRFAALALAVVAGIAGYASAQDNPYYDRDDYRYENRYYDRDDFRRGIHRAREIGFRDGAEVAREDMWRGKPFNPNPRGRYDDADHGYSREFGSIHEYREHYSAAYREGYEDTYRGNRYYR